MMAKVTCKHSAWLQVAVGRAQLKVTYNDILRTLADNLPTPTKQAPSIALFLGTKTKDETLQAIFPQNDFPRQRRQETLFNFRADSTSLKSRYPLYFADVDPSLSYSGPEPGKSRCHPAQTVTVGWTTPNTICIFADDCGGYHAVLSFLTTWAQLGVAAHTPATTRPRVLVIAQDSDANFANIDGLRHEMDQVAGSGHAYASVQIVRLPCREPSIKSNYVRTKNVLLNALDRSRSDKIKQSLLFSARHQESLFTQALAHFAQTMREPFSYLEAARREMEVAPNLIQHIERTFRLGSEAKISDNDLISVTASSILMDAYPPSMHVFEPNVLFQSLYRSSYLHAFSRILESASAAENLCNELQRRFCHFHQSLNIDYHGTAAKIHASNLRHLLASWSTLRSNLTCLSCLRRKPEHSIPCGHAVCDVCLKLFGQNTTTQTGLSESWSLGECPSCGLQTNMMVRLKPDTAGIRVLTVDGGGVKGVVPLESLSLLQQLVGPDCPIQELIDLAFGTSVGGLVILSVFLQHATVEASANVFRSFTQCLFSSKPSNQAKITANLMRVLKTFLQDGMYSSELLQEALISQFGSQTRMFDYHSALTSGTKVAVIACSTKDSSARVFSNYNGEGIRNSDSGYRLERPGDPDNEPLVWQAARATSAAPGLFRPIKIPSVGVYEDGGLKHNNPINIALWEIRHIWPDIVRPDVVLSLGTGHQKPAPSPVVATPKVSFQELFPFRLWRHFMSSMDGQSVWRDLMNRLDEVDQRDYFRLTVELLEEPTLDDFTSIDRLSEAVRFQPQGAQYRRKVAMALLISCFYFELDTMPSCNGPSYYCLGRIRCRSSGVVKSLVKLCPGGVDFFNGSTSLSKSVSIEDLCEKCGRYCKPVHFFTDNLEADVELLLRWGTGSQFRHLSAMPHRLSWFIRMQHLAAPFGSPSEVENRKHGCTSCSPTPRQVLWPAKRQRSSSPVTRRLRNRK